jgi:hypothetical protein
MNIIDVHDYPADKYDAFWEIVINADKKGKAKDMDVARLESQTWVKAQMENYKK